MRKLEFIIAACASLTLTGVLGACEEETPAQERAEERAERQAETEGAGAVDREMAGEAHEELQELKEEVGEQNRGEGFIQKPDDEEGTLLDAPGSDEASP